MLETCVEKNDYAIIIIDDGSIIDLPNKIRVESKTDASTGAVSHSLIITTDPFVGEWSTSCLRVQIRHDDFTKESNCIAITVSCPTTGGFIASLPTYEMSP